MPGVEVLNDSFFNEFTVRLPKPAAPVVEALAAKRILAGVPVSRLDPGRPAVDDLLLLAATETTTDARHGAAGRRPARRCCDGPVARPFARPRRRAAADATADAAAPATFTGNRALQIEEPLIFEMGQPGRCGVDLPEPPKVKDRLNGLRRTGEIGLPGLSEPETVRHYMRLSQKNYAIDLGVYPLGSCTMKHNPRLNEKMARLPGFGDLHPLQPVSTVQGALELIDRLAHWLKTLTGMPAVAMSPKAGAHGEICGMMAIRAALEARGERAQRRTVLAPDSAHGTNPATAAALGFTVKPIPANDARPRRSRRPRRPRSAPTWRRSW